MKEANLRAIKTRFGIIGNSYSLNHALEVSAQVAPTDLSILIVGESGVGKEIFSEIIHKLSHRKHEPFIAINCGAIPEGTIDSELFGHEKGSFTGADKEREGYFEKVNHGTIFLDEIGEMPLGTQARLLRVLETGEYIRVGASVTKKTDVRVIAATNKDLYQNIRQGKFRKDLFYRLNTVPLFIPPLRERKEDIPLLFRKFCIDFSAKYHSKTVELSDKAVELLKDYNWDGNVRQLKNVAEQISVLEDSRLIDERALAAYLPQRTNELAVLSANKQEEAPLLSGEREILYKLFFDLKKDVNELKKTLLTRGMNGILNDGDKPSLLLDERRAINIPIDANLPKKTSLSETFPLFTQKETMDSLNIADKEKELIIKAIEKHHGKKRSAALDLGISERTLYRKLKDYDIDA